MLLFIVAIVFYISIYWAAIYFFKTNSKSAVKGKQLISIIGNVSIIYTLCSLYINAAPIYSFGAISDHRYYMLAIILYILAFVIFWYSYASARKLTFDFAFSSRIPDQLLTSRAYRYVRHPFYTSYIFGWLAPFIFLQTLMSFAVFTGMAAIYIFAARKEESVLLINNKDYAIYKKKTGMFFPFL